MMRLVLALIPVLALLGCPGDGSNGADAGNGDGGIDALQCNARCTASGYARGTLVSGVCLCENDVLDAGPGDVPAVTDSGPAPDAGAPDAGSPGESQITHSCGLLCELGFLDFSQEEAVDCPTDRDAFFGSEDIRRCTLNCLSRYRGELVAKVDLLLSCLQSGTCGQREHCHPDQFETRWPEQICPNLCAADGLCDSPYWSPGDCPSACSSELLREGITMAMGAESCFVYYTGPCFDEDDPQACLCTGQSKCTGRTTAVAAAAADRMCAAAQFCNMVQSDPLGCPAYTLPNLLAHPDMSAAIACIDEKLPAVHANEECVIETFLEVEACLR
jgi:hypothetical protein